MSGVNLYRRGQSVLEHVTCLRALDHETALDWQREPDEWSRLLGLDASVAWNAANHDETRQIYEMGARTVLTVPETMLRCRVTCPLDVCRHLIIVCLHSSTWIDWIDMPSIKVNTFVIADDCRKMDASTLIVVDKDSKGKRRGIGDKTSLVWKEYSFAPYSKDLIDAEQA